MLIFTANSDTHRYQSFLAHKDEDGDTHIEYAIGTAITFECDHISSDPDDFGIDCDNLPEGWHIWEGEAVYHRPGWVGDSWDEGEIEYSGDWRKADFRAIRKFLKQWRDCRWRRRGN